MPQVVVGDLTKEDSEVDLLDSLDKSLKTSSLRLEYFLKKKATSHTIVQVLAKYLTYEVYLSLFHLYNYILDLRK